ncbi:FAD-dependent oxidoreductase [Calderihabitans maritimus]|uniref:NADPH-dependent glutamate synthase beta chain and related oxidoreductases n=1 Tax=Calderihabitans maritimus TaxID=1246530 RepID=A0A1Z5HQN3_9FIRM|nr:FAD-dependent oxidoreductase [Calderihabitans maritimus]GAW91843.1 NADPH-dependent glutamate synthase beta chain and related oxidoreductases [Calderihabitans maritimus]
MNRRKSEITGSVLVVGSGIAGMQSALDLANAGYLVHLVTDQPSIGGKMTQLDKTFPTNECAMCLLGPKMTDTLSHPNIDLYTCSRVEKVEGEKGNFTVTVRKFPRYIDIEECTACGDCEQACPVQVKNEFNQEMDNRKAVYKLFPQAVPNKYMIEKRGTPPCRSTCPAGTNAQGYVALISQGKFKEALEVVRRRMPFAGICGRICHHPCETECNRAELDDPIAIAYLKRAAFDYGWTEETAASPQPEEKRSEKIAVIGAGPAGLTAALDLSLKGYQVTVFDALPEPGGMLRAGIPRYRLPEEVVKRETAWILGAGIEFRGNTHIGKDISFDELKKQGYRAILIAVGTQKSRLLKIEGSDQEGIVGALDFLRQAALGEKPPVGRRVLIIGGGNVAIDAARTALRLGAEEVHLACLESREEMPAHEWEIEEAIEEGVQVHPSWGPKRFLGDGKRVTGVELIQCSAVFDAEGRFNPQFVEGSEKTFDADMVIVAIGQASDLSFLPQDGGIEITRQGTIVVDPVTMATGAEGVFACGDIVSGPASVVEAVASAHEAAESIHRYLNGEDIKAGRERSKPAKLTPPDKTVYRSGRRVVQPMADPSERTKDFREVYLGFTEEMAIEEAQRCLNCGICSECLQCEAVCKKKAVQHWQTETTEEIKVGAIIAAPGYDLFDARLTGEFGYGVYENVLTSMEFERLLSSTGPTKGHVERPSDGKPPVRVAFIQCVGSRDCARDGSEYCSSICCMYSTKEAIIAREHDSNIEPTIFYLDMRSYGKNFDKYVDSAKAAGVRYVRTMISSVKEDPHTKNLFIQYLKDGEVVTEEFDLVVLAVGVRPPKSAQELADALGIRLNKYGFAETNSLNPTESSREGIYVAGAFQGPRDIPETVMNASAAAATASGMLAEARGQLQRHKEYPAEKDVSREEPRIGVFVCHCGINIGAIVDVPQVVEFAKTLPGVVHAEENLYTCSQDTLKKIKEVVEEQNLNRVVVASCTIRTHQPLFREACREAGLNQFLFEMANIRDQCSWVHRETPDKATEKAKDLVRAAVAKVRGHEPLHLHPVPVVPKALIVGGGIAGMTAALSMAEQGFASYLVEKEPELGGYLRNLRYSIDGQDLQQFLKETIAKVEANDMITVYCNARLEDFGGHQGHFVTTISQATPEREHVRKTIKLEHGVVIIATGAQEYIPDEYLMGQDERVITNTQLEQQLASGQWQGEKIKQVVMIQCVGSRDEERKYCSRTCCAQSIKNALKIKELSPNTQVYILYRDIRTYGFMEEYYKEAREKGVVFIHYDPERKPELRQRNVGVLELEIFDEAAGSNIVLWPDQVVLATATVAPDGIQSLASMLKLTLNEDQFFVETHAKLGPIDFPSAGIFLCGAAHSPKFVSEAIYQAQGAVARACTILSKENLMVGGVVATVDEEKCAACLTCVRACPYNVPRINERFVAEINAVQCQGCGTCAAECPAKAIQLQHYKDEQLLAKVAGLFGEVR